MESASTDKSRCCYNKPCRTTVNNNRKKATGFCIADNDIILSHNEDTKKNLIADGISR